MSTRNTWGLAVGLLLPLCIGCANNQGLVRAQSPPAPPVHPAAYAASAHTVSPAGGWSHGQAYSGQCESCENGYTGPGGCDRCGSNGCGNGSCLHGHRGDWHPTHQHFFHYDAPDDLVYPPALTPAAVVQYPYYTVKGPDDFFLK